MYPAAAMPSSWPLYHRAAILPSPPPTANNSLISDDLRKGLLDRAEHTFQLALTLAVGSGVAVMVLMEVGTRGLGVCCFFGGDAPTAAAVLGGCVC